VTSTAGFQNCAGARERLGAACTGILPDSSATFPTNHRINGPDFRASTVGVHGTGGCCDVDRRLPTARVLASGWERLVLASSRIVLRLSRLIIASMGLISGQAQWDGVHPSGARATSTTTFWWGSLEPALDSAAAFPFLNIGLVRAILTHPQHGAGCGE